MKPALLAETNSAWVYTECSCGVDLYAEPLEDVYCPACGAEYEYEHDCDLCGGLDASSYDMLVPKRRTST